MLFHSPASYSGSINIYAVKIHLFPLQTWAPQGAAIWVRSSPVKTRKCLARDVIDMPHMPTLFMTSQAQSARCKKATLTAVFCDFQMLIVNNADDRLKLLWVYYIYSISVDRASGVSLLWVPINAIRFQWNPDVNGNVGSTLLTIFLEDKSLNFHTVSCNL